MAAPTLETNAGATILRITDGTSGDPVTWNDVWDWDDGGGSSGGAGDVPVDGGGTAKVNTFITEVVADVVYTVEKDVQFGDGSTTTYFVSENEQVYFLKTPRTKAAATVRLGDVVEGWGYKGSSWIFADTTSDVAFCDGGNIYLYDSKLHITTNSRLGFKTGNAIIKNSNLSGNDIVSGSDTFWFWASMTSVELKDVYVSNLWAFMVYISPDADDLHIHHTAYGYRINSQNATVSGVRITDFGTNDYRLEPNDSPVLTLIDPKTSVVSPIISAGDPNGLIEKYTVNIHTTDKDGVDLQSVDVDCEYAHLVEGSDAKTYKCVQDHTSVDATHKPITGSDWASFWELYDAAGGLGGDWQTTFDFKAGTQEFATATTDANGDITEQIIQYRKWVGTSELLEVRIHKFTYTHASYPDSIIDLVIVDHPLVWRFDMGQSTADLAALMAGPGDNAVAVTIKTTGGTAIPGVSVWVSTSNDRSTADAGVLVTDDAGLVTFNLDYTTYYVFCHLAGYTFNAASFTAAAGSVTFSKSIGVAISTGVDSNYVDSFITRGIDLVRLYLEEPVLNAKYSDTQIIEQLERSYIHVVSEKNRNALTPIVAKFDVTIASGTQSYILPNNIASIVAIYESSSFGTKVFMNSRSEHNSLGRFMWIEGNVLHIQNGSLLTTGWTLTVEYIPSGTSRLHNGTCGVNSDGTEITFGATPFQGILDTHVNAYLGDTIRILTVTGSTVVGDMLQERTITAYDNSTRVATVSEALAPVPTTDDGSIFYEIAPAVHKGMDAVVPIHSAYVLAGVEGKQSKRVAMRDNYKETIRNVRLTAYNSRLDEASTVHGDNHDNRMYPYG